MGELIDEAVYEHVRGSEQYQQVMAVLQEMLEDGDECAFEAVTIINSVIPPETKKPTGPPVGKPQEVPRPKTPEVQKKHIKKSGK